MSGLLALLDDVTAIAKVAAASIDDIAASTAKAGAKAAGIVIDDAAVTPKYVTGLAPAREPPIIGRIAMGSLKNKLLILLPAVLLLQAFAPWIITPLLMFGGAYLCFEGAEKVLHAIQPQDHGEVAKDMSVGDPATLEAQRVRGAIKTDFILSAEIMVLSLSVIDADSIVMRGITLAVVGAVITAAVYGTVALLVKIDDVGLHMTLSRSGAMQAVGRGLVHAMPKVFTLLTVVGTAAMCWVGGNIIIHGLDVLGWPTIYDWIHHIAEGAAHAVPVASGVVAWAVTAGIDGILGLLLGLLLVPVVLHGVKPLFGKKQAAH